MSRAAMLLLALLVSVTASRPLAVQQPAASESHDDPLPVSLQPLAQQVRRLETTLAYLGQPLRPADRERIDAATALTDERRAVEAIEAALAPHVLLDVTINPESRVSVAQGEAPPLLVESGSRLFLVRVRNQAGVTAALRVSSPSSGRVSTPAWSSDNAPEPPMRLTAKDVAERWAEISLYDQPPMSAKLSGLGLEYAILQIYSRDRGSRAAELHVDVGQGSQDIGFRNAASIVFTAEPAHDVTFRVRDERGRPGIAAFTIRDAQGRLYPLAAKRLAPDLPFQPQIYRSDDESVRLPDGRYEIAYSAGPEYETGAQALDVSGDTEPVVSVALRRWIDPARYGWYSGDHHVHAAGCSHYENPTLGVDPSDMMRQVRGEALNVGAVLTWGPCYYHQKQFFSGSDDPLSTEDRLLHYDLEVSGFPSSHAGHLVLLGLRDQDYPGTTRIEDWPSWDLPVLRWAAAQGAVVGFAHSGWGLETKARDLPNYEMPPFDGIGANEYIVDVTHPGAVDFISAIDTPYPWELNIWYHTLNVGFRTRLSGETDFPCITDERVGAGRTYAKLDRLTYAGFLDAVKRGRSYVSDGRTHLMDFTVNGVEIGTGDSEVRVSPGTTAHVTVRVAARLDAVPNVAVRDRAPEERPYWSVERARVGDSREIAVELVMNGVAVARSTVPGDGAVHDVAFDVPVAISSWLAVRAPGAAHTNPIFAIVSDKPIRASRRSAEWCLAAVNQCWTQKARNIRPSERDDAVRAYDHAREVYRRLVEEAVAP